MEDGHTLRDIHPNFIGTEVWEQMCRIWEGSPFKKMSAQRTAARSQSSVPHCTGSQSYDLFRERLQDLKHPPSCLEFWWHAHQKKCESGYISPEAEAIGNRFSRLTGAWSTQRAASGQ